MPELERAHAISQYDGGIAYADAQIAHLIDWLKQWNLYDNTLIVVTSDHGESFGERNLVEHGNSVYQNLLHVPLIIKFPHSDRKGVVDDPVSLTDIFPTILSTLGYGIPKRTQGQDLTALTLPGPREIFGESFPCPVLHSPACAGGCLERTIYSWPFKFLTFSNGRYELYNLSTDPAESRNIAASERDTAKQLGLNLSRWTKAMPAQAAQKVSVDKEVMQRLKGLGYAQ
jgi:arylsulfatase A-like enzyme